MRKTAIIILLSVMTSITLKADEGMWLPSLIAERIGDMQKKGFKLDADDIYNINQASLKDAVVLFGRGCTGEVISAEGLLITNHHCGYGQIQKHSSVEHDYLRDGFWAMNRNEELPNPGLSVSFLEKMEDVTAQVLDGYTPGMKEEERTAIVKKNSKKIIETATQAGKGLRATVEGLYYGNQYFLFVYREYKDIRLVGAPPSSIGKFGGETDNWMWPRHTGDFSIFRIYADKDNNPAEYSKDNIPYSPKKYFKISISGVKEGDFTFIYGFPGRTQEYIHSEAVRYIADISDPHKIALRTQRLNIMDKYMGESQAVRIQYSAKKASVANAWKKWQGEAGGIKKMNTVATKQAYEAAFEQWAKGTEYEKTVAKLAELYKELESYNYASEYYTETIRAVELLSFALRIGNMCALGKVDLEQSKAAIEAFYKDYYLPIDKETFVAMFEAFEKNVPENFQPQFFWNQMKIYGTAKDWAEDLFTTSIFADKQNLIDLINCHDKEHCAKHSGKDVITDPAYVIAKEFTRWYEKTIAPVTSRLNAELQLLYRDYMRGQMEFAKATAAVQGKKAQPKSFYPDANLTLRVAYGKIAGYSPSDAIYYYPSSSLKGIMEKDNPNIFDYNIPQKLRDIYAARDFGRWTDGNGEVPVCFIATNHTTGGNSGSPVIDRHGNLIGINFDRVWEGTMSDIVFDPDFCRNISLDIRYVLFIIDKVAGAHHLLDEMTFVETSKNGKKAKVVNL